MIEPKAVTYKVVKDMKRSDILLSMAMDGESLYSGGSSATVFEVQNLEEKPEDKRKLEGHQSYITGLTKAGKYLISGAYDKKLIWWDIEKGEKVREIDAHKRWVRGVEASPDNKLIASVADDMVARIWDTESGKLKHELKGHEAYTPNHFDSMLYCCKFSPDGKILATGDRIGHVVLWDVKTGKQIRTLSAPGVYTWDPRARIHSIGGLRSLAFSSDGKTLVIGGMGKVGNIDHLQGKARVELFDVESAKSLAVIESDKFKGLVECLEFGPNNDWFLAAGGDHKGWFIFIDTKEKKIITQDQLNTHIHEFKLSEDHNKIHAVGHGLVTVWQKS